MHSWLKRPVSFVRRPRIVKLFRRLGGDRTLASPVKSRVRYRYATSLDVRRGAMAATPKVGRKGFEPSSLRLKAGCSTR